MVAVSRLVGPFVCCDPGLCFFFSVTAPRSQQFVAALKTEPTAKYTIRFTGTWG